MPPKGSLASLLGQLTNAAPAEFDPEALDADQPEPSTFANGNSDSASDDDDEDDEEDDDAEEGDHMNPRAHYADVGPSELRKKAALSESDKINDPRYHGVKTTRAELFAGDDDEEDDEDEDEDEDIERLSQGSSDSEDDDDSQDEDEDEDDEEAAPTSQPKEKKKLRFAEEHGSRSANGDSDDGADAGASGSNSIAAQMAQSASQARALRARRVEDAEKGRQVRKQVKAYERALEARIKAQNVLRDVNRLPDPSPYSAAMSSSSSAMEPAIQVLEQLLELSETLFSLRTRLHALSANAEDDDTVDAPITRKRKRDFDVTVPEDVEEAESTWSQIRSHDQIDAVMHDVAAFSAASEPHRSGVLDKWSLKVTSAAAAASAASNGNKFTQLRAVNQTPSTQIAAALAGDGLGRLVARTRVLRTESEGAHKLGRTVDADQVDVEVFDDSDFYSALLKELIERRSGVVPSADGTTAAMMLSGLSGNKKNKPAVDTRASKGRKLRYEVHDKIVNFMPPIPDRVKWGTDQIDRLFRQLASSSVGVVPDSSVVEDVVDDADAAIDGQPDLAGLRVFG
ncbi:TRAUB-domain-containing protein [Moesziomyces antarcticus]|uniref:Protein BFR2 n=2 Tax=Pseudozyma antarctica TaxID=84753 RepID=A0A081CIS1_PSEA2|nr:TRAUB-domain-containing protein [Moesziomyces antarcticus]GAK66567.1 TRAUB-domain-containing protein [Moesziomyces antarcticus]SPO47614.1 related to BFR2 - involved in protein transport steps at the Brefeldin A blocks [Moesziomyces antarcticus]